MLVNWGEFPQRVWESHSAVISLEVQEVPFLSSLLLINIWLIGEAVELVITLCNAKQGLKADEHNLHFVSVQKAKVLQKQRR